MKKVIDLIKTAENIALFCHINCDGDAVGSVFALKRILEEFGKSVTVFIDTKIPERLKFMPKVYDAEYLTVYEDRGFDLFIALDCGDLKRLGEFAEVFEKAENTISIDHHASNSRFAKENVVVPDASATGEVLYDLTQMGNFLISKETATLLYGAIASDTGSFQYQNTSSKTHMIASKLIELGADSVMMNKKLFDTLMVNEIKIKGYAMSNFQLFEDGKICLVSITKDVMEKVECLYEDVEGISGFPRSVDGVEIGLLVKEWKDNVFKVSIRTNNYVDATVLAGKFGGGGHIKASGCTIEGSIDEVKEKIVKAAKELI